MNPGVFDWCASSIRKDTSGRSSSERRADRTRTSRPASLKCGFGQVSAKEPIEFGLQLEEFLSTGLRVIIRLREFPHAT
jgi:hypothetical protein